MKKYFAYTRVSTTRQGELGVSLQQQREAIARFAGRSGFQVVEWLEEQETAARTGRSLFTQMLKRLRKGEADGVIMHKIDRSARNLKDWAELGQLIDQGIEVSFANEALDLNSRGGRLSADIQAVVAADFIRNLREETKKGFYGRLKQGLYPRPAPPGYLNCGSGKPKIIDPVHGPIVRQAFELYASGRHSLITLTKEVRRLGLRSRTGNLVGLNVVHRMLRNPFYIGLLRIDKVKQVFQGNHEHLISKSIFTRVQDLLSGKRTRGTSTHSYLFSRLLRCKTCGRSLIAELHKGRIYYRCHSSGCRLVSIREDRVEVILHELARRLTLSPREELVLDEIVAEKRKDKKDILNLESEGLKLQLAAIDERQRRLVDAFIEQVMDRSELDERKTALQEERRRIEGKLDEVGMGHSGTFAHLEKFVELVKTAPLLMEHLLFEEKRKWIVEAMSNRSLEGKTLDLSLDSPLREIAMRSVIPDGRAHRDKVRTFWKRWVSRRLRKKRVAKTNRAA